MSPDPRFTLLGVGELLWDRLPAGDRLGGAPANFAYHATVLGENGLVASAVGTDTGGDALIAQAVASGLDTRLVQRTAEHPTGTVDVSTDDEGIPDYTIHTDVAYDFTEATEDLVAAARSADAFCFGTLGQRGEVSRATIRQLLTVCRPDCLRVFDINLRQSFHDAPMLLESIRAADVLKLNDEELPVLAACLGIDRPEEECPAAILQEFDLKLIALTLGVQGSLLITAEDTHHQTPERVQVRDTVGAGDAFTAALTVGLLRERPVPQIHAAASRLAAHVCSCDGAMPAVPEALVQALAE